MAATFQNIGKAHDITLDIGVGVLHGVAHTRLGSKVDDALKLFGGKQLRNGCVIGNIHPLHPEIAISLQLLQTVFLEPVIMLILPKQVACIDLVRDI